MTAEQVMADTAAFDALIVEEDWGRLRAATDTAMATMSPFDIEIQQRTLRGDIRWVHHRVTPRERLADGSVMWSGVVVDVTERKRVEEELREREALLRNLSDNLPDATIYQVVRRPDGSNYFPYISEGQASTYGLTREQVIADPSHVYGLIVDEDLKKLRATADESLRTLTAIEVECRQRTAGGEERWVQIRARPRRLPDGSTLWDAVSLDITARKRAEEALLDQDARLRQLDEDLRRSEERYRLLFERSLVGIFRTRADGILLECNDAFARMLGYHRGAEVRGGSVLEHYAAATDRDMILARLSAGEDVTGVELIARRRDGSHVPVAVSVRRVVDQEGAIHEGVLVDLTERKQAEAAATLRSVAELANAAAHEINNPLTTIVGQLTLITQGGDIAGRIDQMRVAADRIRDIVKHMERITRLEPSVGWPAEVPRMLDIRRSGTPQQDIMENP
jgi:PAS domain S-box-containing protein